MVLDLNINDITKPVIEEVNRGNFVKRFIVKTLQKSLIKRLVNINSTLDDTILRIEGTYAHLKELTPESAIKTLLQIKESIEKLENLYDVVEEECDFLDNDNLKLKYKYLLKALYKSEAITHKIAYREKETLKTDDTIKDGIIKMNSYLYKKSV